MKFLLIILDGAGDIGEETPLSKANKPNMDFLAKRGVTGLINIGYKKKADSDVGYLTLLGCYSEKEYPGRGYLEALGIGVEPEKDDVVIRGNFATLGEDGNIIDRRAGRDERGLDGLAEKLDGMEIDGVRFTAKRSAGHRIVIALRGNNLSDNIIPNDPQKVNVPLPQVGAKDPSAKFTASVLNKFVYKANKILVNEEINKEREFPANTVLIRNAGKRKTTLTFKERFGLKGCCVAGIPIAKGVARFLGMDVIEVPGATGLPVTNLSGKTDAVIKFLDNYDFIFLHINGTDTLSHSRKPEKKKEFIEKIDREIGRMLEKADLNETVFMVTCDHISASSPSFKGYEHLTDPVPVLISGDAIKPDNTKNFDEKSAEKGSLRIETTGLIPFVLKLASLG